jgi:hypothetical protein
LKALKKEEARLKRGATDTVTAATVATVATAAAAAILVVTTERAEATGAPANKRGRQEESAEGMTTRSKRTKI